MRITFALLVLLAVACDSSDGGGGNAGSPSNASVGSGASGGGDASGGNHTGGGGAGGGVGGGDGNGCERAEPRDPRVGIHYIREGGTASMAGTGACVGWALNEACDDLPEVLVRGDVYLVAEGSYAGRDLTTAADGTIPITIEKACGTDHGTDRGWSSDLGDGQASFGELRFGSDHWLIDGSLRGADWGDTASYGFRVSGLSASTAAFPGVCASHLTFQFVDVGGPPGTVYTGGEPGEAIYVGGFDELCTDLTVRSANLHNIRSYALMQLAGLDGGLIERTRLQHAWGKEAIRGQIAARNLVIRHNQFLDACGNTGRPGEGCTAEIALWDGSAGQFDGNRIYGNWFLRTRDENSGGTIVVGGNGTSWAGAPATNTEVYNNTIAGIAGSGVGGLILVNGDGNMCRNNLWWDAVGAGCSVATSSDNVVAEADPFIAYSMGDLHLAAPTAGGTALASPYDIDQDGQTRGTDGVWDVGAYEF
jgi:hypothetical protein